jgi:inhibitor of cysteine peptidase
MNRLALVGMLVFFSIGFAAAQSRIEVAAGKMFALAVEANPTTGFQWELSQPLDETKVKLVDSFYKAPAAHRVGAAGVQLWIFKAVGKGETTISAKYIRSWEKEAAPAKTASFAVLIK